MVSSFRSGRPLLAGAPTYLLVVLLQWPLIVLHELGHALFARAFRYESIRIFIGSGKTLFHFPFAGFIWIINLIPFGGLTYAKPLGRVIRWQWILFVAGGLIVNALLLLGAWVASRLDIPLPSNLFHALLWANALIIAENIIPQTAQTLYGPLSSDGKLLYDAIFRWNKPPLAQKNSSNGTHLVLRILRYLGVALLVCCAAITLLIAFSFYFMGQLRQNLFLWLALTLFFLVLASLLLWYAWRLLKSPLTSTSNPSQPPGLPTIEELHSYSSSKASPEALATIQSHFLAGEFQSAHLTAADLLHQHPGDCALLWMQFDALALLNQPAAAEAASDRLLAQLIAGDPSLPNKPGLYFTVVGKRLQAIMLQNEGRFEIECIAALNLLVSDQHKIRLLDQLACIPLFQGISHLYHLSEFCIRKALEIAPGTLTIQGTLGGLLAEQGRFSEAEPHLRACYDRSAALNDRGISSYYLALLAHHQGDRPTARKLAKQSIALYPEPWLTAKANTLVTRIESTPRRISTAH